VYVCVCGVGEGSGYNGRGSGVKWERSATRNSMGLKVDGHKSRYVLHCTCPVRTSTCTVSISISAGLQSMHDVRFLCEQREG
jgi:hypothetical protein